MESCPTEVSDTMKVRPSIHKCSFSTLSKDLNSSLDQASEISEIIDVSTKQVNTLRKNHKIPPRLPVIFRKHQKLMFQYLLIFQFKFGLKNFLSSVFSKRKDNKSVCLKMFKIMTNFSI